MKALISNPWGRTLCLIMLISISVGSTPKSDPGDDTLQITKDGLEATLKIESCGDNRIVTIAWKNTNAHTAIGVMSLTSKSEHNALLAITVVVPANQVKTETCETVDVTYRTVSFTNFSDVQAELTLAN